MVVGAVASGHLTAIYFISIDSPCILYIMYVMLIFIWLLGLARFSVVFPVAYPDFNLAESFRHLAENPISASDWCSSLWTRPDWDALTGRWMWCRAIVPCREFCTIFRTDWHCLSGRPSQVCLRSHVIPMNICSRRCSQIECGWLAGWLVAVCQNMHQGCCI